MRISDTIAQAILEMMKLSGGTAEIQRNEFAGQIGCVPSQINYVLTSRFTPENGYIIESRRGGGGYIRVTRINLSSSEMQMHLINCIGDEVDDKSARAMIENLSHRNIFSIETANLIVVATSEQALRNIPTEYRNKARAQILKQMLLVTLR